MRPAPYRHIRLRNEKNAAYAWRCKLVFFLSFVDDVEAFIAHALSSLSARETRAHAALRGLRHVVRRGPFDENGAAVDEDGHAVARWFGWWG